MLNISLYRVSKSFCVSISMYGLVSLTFDSRYKSLMSDIYLFEWFIVEISTINVYKSLSYITAFGIYV